MSKYNLDFEYEIDFELIGVASALPGFKIAWHINKTLDLNLCRIDDYKIKINDTQRHDESNNTIFDNDSIVERRYSRYKYLVDEEELCYELISFRSHGKPIEKNIKGFDYLLKINAPDSISEKIIERLNKSKVFNLVKLIDTSDLILEFIE